jgi:hypothetical protein
MGRAMQLVIDIYLDDIIVAASREAWVMGRQRGQDPRLADGAFSRDARKTRSSLKLDHDLDIGTHLSLSSLRSIRRSWTP